MQGNPAAMNVGNVSIWAYIGFSVRPCEQVGFNRCFQKLRFSKSRIGLGLGGFKKRRGAFFVSAYSKKSSLLGLM